MDNRATSLITVGVWSYVLCYVKFKLVAWKNGYGSKALIFTGIENRSGCDISRSKSRVGRQGN